MADRVQPKRLYWVGSSKRDLCALPEAVVDVFGYALYLAQLGKKHEQAKPLKGFGSAGVLEVVEDRQGNTRIGRSTRCALRALPLVACVREEVEARHSYAERGHQLDTRAPQSCREDRRGAGVMKKERQANGVPVEAGTGNVYADLQYARNEEMLIKAPRLKWPAVGVWTDRCIQVEFRPRADRVAGPRLAHVTAPPHDLPTAHGLLPTA